MPNITKLLLTGLPKGIGNKGNRIQRKRKQDYTDTVVPLSTPGPSGLSESAYSHASGSIEGDETEVEVESRGQIGRKGKTTRASESKRKNTSRASGSKRLQTEHCAVEDPIIDHDPKGKYSDPSPKLPPSPYPPYEMPLPYPSQSSAMHSAEFHVHTEPYFSYGPPSHRPYGSPFYGTHATP